MKSINTQQTVGDIVTQAPGLSRVFESLGIDYCCGGKVSLADACRKKGVSLENVLLELSLADYFLEAENMFSHSLEPGLAFHFILSESTLRPSEIAGRTLIVSYHRFTLG